MGRVLTAQQLQEYDRAGYVLARGAVDADALGLARTVLERWVDQTVDAWVGKGLLNDPLREVGFSQRLAEAWQAAGRPNYHRSPRRDLVSPELYRFFTDPRMLDLAEDLLGIGEIHLHGIFNARPKLPDQKWTDTPWHQDAQYFRDAADVHVATLWIPLQRVTPENSCLMVAPGHHRDRLHDAHDDKATGFIGLSPEVYSRLQGVPIEMDPGDVLCFTQKTPHAAMPNRTDSVRWSIDMRYDATPTATSSGTPLGFVARSREHPNSVESCDQWLKKWQHMPPGSW